MGRAIFLQAMGDYLRPRRIAAWVIAALFGMLLALIWPMINAQHTDAIEAYSAGSLTVVFRILSLASAIFASANISAEIEQRTIVYLVTRPVPRWLLILVRYLACVLVVSMICIFAAILVSAAAYRGNPFANPLLGRDVLALVLGAFTYGGLFLFVTLLFNRSMIICLIYAFAWETIVPQMPGTMYYLSINSHLQALAAHPAKVSQSPFLNFVAGLAGTNTISESVAAPVLVLLTLATAAAAAWWFTHFEFVPRDDVE